MSEASPQLLPMKMVSYGTSAGMSSFRITDISMISCKRPLEKTVG